MKYINLLLLLAGFILLYQCADHAREQMEGVWKMEKVEIRRNSVLHRQIFADQQYWQFDGLRSLDIFDTTIHRQHMLVRWTKSSILHIDSNNGNTIQVYEIKQLGKGKVELFCQQRSEDADYTIHYFLDRLADSAVFKLGFKF